MGYVYIGLTILLTVFGQMVLKWQVSLAGSMPAAGGEKLTFIFGVLTRPWVLGGFIAAFLASVAWMAAMTKFDLGFAYPFMSLNFVLVIGLSALLFHEPLTPAKLAGLALIVLGIVVGGLGEAKT